MPRPESHHICVIGAGLAGLSAAVHAAASGASVICFERSPLRGGLVANVGRLDDYPSPAATSGAALADQLLARARDSGVTMVTAQVTSLAPVGGGFTIGAESLTCFSQAVIVASGGRLRQLGVPGERELAGRGVSQCDWCDGGLYRGKRVAVVGGGNAALQAALHLAELCESVTVISRGAGLRARRDYVLRAADKPKIEFLWETQVEAVVGSDGVEGLTLTSVPDALRWERPFSAVFVFAGIVPNLDFAPTLLDRDEGGFARTDSAFRSSIPGVFVVGAARSGNGGSLVSAMGEAMTAAAAAIVDLRRVDAL